MNDYTTRDVAAILDVPAHRIRRYARSGFLRPERGARRAYRFSFQDLILMQTAVALEAASVPAKRIHASLRALRAELPDGIPLTSVRIVAEGDRVVVYEQDRRWNPETGQLHFVLDVAELAARAEHIRATSSDPVGDEPGPDGWFAIGCHLETDSPGEARQAYRRALELDPGHLGANINLGTLMSDEARYAEARDHYRRAFAAHPGDATAAFNLGVVLEDLGEPAEAMEAYREAIAADPRMADAYYNLALLYERRDDRAAALRHFQSYRDLTRG